METNRSSFTGKIGFILAAAGSAVGLGNIWRFPYLAAKYGGGIFLLVYLILAITFGFTLMCAVIAIGRKSGQSAINAFGVLNKKYKFIGLLASIMPMLILPYYCVIGGWVTKYFTVFAGGNVGAAAQPDFFGNYIGQTGEPIAWFLLYIGLTSLIVLFGVEKGIEKVSKIMMPVLIILTLAIAIYTMFMPGAMDGVLYYVVPDFSNFSIKTVLAAMGQLFYSMSLAMGIMITYGSYMKKEVSIESSVRSIELFDTGIAFLAGMMVIPAVFACGDPTQDLAKAGPTLMFVVLPRVFNSLGTITGSIVGAAFFILVFFAALSSSISLMETVVSIFRDKFGWSRKFTCLFVFILSVILGLPSCLGFSALDFIQLNGMSILDMFDFGTNSILMPIVALLTCYFIGFVMKPKALSDEISLTGKFKSQRMFEVIIKYIAPVCILLILISSILDGLGIVKL